MVCCGRSGLGPITTGSDVEGVIVVGLAPLFWVVSFSRTVIWCVLTTLLFF